MYFMTGWSSSQIPALNFSCCFYLRFVLLLFSSPFFPSLFGPSLFWCSVRLPSVNSSDAGKVHVSFQRMVVSSFQISLGSDILQRIPFSLGSLEIEDCWSCVSVTKIVAHTKKCGLRINDSVVSRSVFY